MHHNSWLTDTKRAEHFLILTRMTVSVLSHLFLMAQLLVFSRVAVCVCLPDQVEFFNDH